LAVMGRGRRAIWSGAWGQEARPHSPRVAYMVEGGEKQDLTPQAAGRVGAKGKT
jgi:hypothetical protein